MKLVSFSHDARHSFGVATDSGIIDIGAKLTDKYKDVRDVLSRGGLADVAAASSGVESDFNFDEVSFERPVRFPEKIICVGVNYQNRNDEYKDNSSKQRYPSIFMRTPGSLVGHHAPLVKPPESDKFDYEGEIVIVIGKGGRRIPQSDAATHIAGLTVMNEGSIRDWLRHAKFNVTQGKNFERSGSIGPWITTTDEVIDKLGGFDNLDIKTIVNGDVRQSDNTSNLEFPFGYLISYVSTFTTLKPGDIIATGTPTGAGASMDPPVFLKPGDQVVVQVEGVGELINSVVDE